MSRPVNLERRRDTRRRVSKSTMSVFSRVVVVGRASQSAPHHPNLSGIFWSPRPPHHHPMADFFVAQFLDEWSSSEGEKKGPPKYDRKCMEVDFMLVSSSPTLQCRGPAYPGDVKCRVADRLMNQHHNEFLRLRDWVDLGEGRRLVTDPHRLAHFMLRSREIVAAEVGACAPPKRLEHIKNPFLTKAQCRQCVRNGDLDVLTQRDKEVVQTRRAQLLGALHGLRMRDGGTVEATVAEIVCERLEKKTKRARE